MLTKSEIRSSSSRLKCWPKVKLGKVQVGSNIAQNHSSSPIRKSYLVIICPNLHEKFTKCEFLVKLLFAPIRFYLPLFGPKIPVLSIFSLTYLYLAVFRLNYPYLGIFALNCPDFTICALFTLYMYSSIETAPLCKIVEQSDHYSWRYLHSKDLGIQVSSSECSLGVNLVIDNFF